jgi:hypothetical protein
MLHELCPEVLVARWLYLCNCALGAHRCTYQHGNALPNSWFRRKVALSFRFREIIQLSDQGWVNHSLSAFYTFLNYTVSSRNVVPKLKLPWSSRSRSVSVLIFCMPCFSLLLLFVLGLPECLSILSVFDKALQRTSRIRQYTKHFSSVWHLGESK